jgi:endonuclease/exonuclease/phosphatase family metal-dependent hydrolase
MAVLKDLMLREYEKGNFVITGGDWNQNPVGYSIGQFSNSDVGKTIEPQIARNFLPEGWQWVFDPEIPTNRDVDQPYTKGKTPTTIIDFFVVSPNVSVIDVKTEDLGFQWCDHQPVRMVFRLGLQSGD